MKKYFMIVISSLLIILFVVSPNISYATSEKTAYIDVVAATIWAEPNIAREIDQPSVTNPVDLWKWTTSMTLDDKLWLVGKLETQALYGEKVYILEEKGDWVKVAVEGQPTPRHDKGYPGWMPKNQLTTNKTFDKLSQHRFAMVSANTAWLYHDKHMKKPFMEISFNTKLPVIIELKGTLLVATPNNGFKWLSANDVNVYQSIKDIPAPTQDSLVETAKQFIGLPYLWAGTSGFGFDCSGFTHNVYKHHGITIPRDSSVQAVHGTPVEKENLQKGDLLFFAYNEGKGRVHHVGMYIGDGKMIHSPNSSSSVEIIDVWSSGYAIEFSGARRYLD
ncbi:C40 family peptidase [Bacillus aquiflavi]|uniref:C40 family peptidase n=1 Tax=Bacillus aquiflavi TaxID=2672567 RepID=A0A6B3VWT3_9BACI|nr:C40 family peptidase [Bacillus aquiflavi]MBA4536369.1 C40 family peptidase [Bacillus aquiflavi]NEY80737.1 C40 family peptidase [Bacillus aquiflavi]UAC48063.1 C40 family peptidase [Bacillus aquiflavi]